MEAATTRRAITITLPDLNDGEHYAGLILKEDGTPDYHLILLPGDKDNLTWKAAGKWATEQGGDLPTRREQSLLFANAAQHFEKDWYWSNAQFASYSDYTWYQDFTDCGQSNFSKSAKLRARAVRRLPV